jgi:hypothetical protein
MKFDFYKVCFPAKCLVWWSAKILTSQQIILIFSNFSSFEMFTQIKKPLQGTNSKNISVIKILLIL